MKKILFALLAVIAVLPFASAQTHPLNPREPADGGYLAVRGPTRARVLATNGRCEYSYDGTNYTRLAPGDIVYQGASIRTGAYGTLDLSLEHVGTVVRLRPDSEVRIEALSSGLYSGMPQMLTILDVKLGRMFLVVRYVPVGSRIEVRNTLGRASITGNDSGKYIITANGVQVPDRETAVDSEKTGITALAAGQEFGSKEGSIVAEADAASESLIAGLDTAEKSDTLLRSAPQILPGNGLRVGHLMKLR